tara:strand:- start:133 stop:396 length:264 start_codon:yes stop_codon:yes gene_type:complete
LEKELSVPIILGSSKTKSERPKMPKRPNAYGLISEQGVSRDIMVETAQVALRSEVDPGHTRVVRKGNDVFRGKVDARGNIIGNVTLR